MANKPNNLPKLVSAQWALGDASGALLPPSAESGYPLLILVFEDGRHATVQLEDARPIGHGIRCVYLGQDWEGKTSALIPEDKVAGINRILVDGGTDDKLICSLAWDAVQALNEGEFHSRSVYPD